MRSTAIRHARALLPLLSAVGLWLWLIRASYTHRTETSETPAAPPMEARSRWPHPLAYGDAAIYGPTDPSPALAGAISDAAANLERMTGRTPSVHAGSSDRGIVLVRSNGLVVPGETERLANAGPESFLIRSDDDRQLRIVAHTDDGLARGLYYYLRELGFRWFMPADEWTVVPRAADVAVRLDRFVEPAFRSRWLFVTGAFGPSNPVDPSGRLNARMGLWMTRNGWGRQFSLGGHAGEVFALANRAELEAHPEYLALVSGKRVPWSTGAHYCVSNPGLQALFAKDRVLALKRTIARYPDLPEASTVSVEPADTPGRCECDRCRKIGKGTESDQTFFLANVAAKAVREQVPGDRWVSVLAYSFHAAPPAFALEPNVHVGVVPESFQQTGLNATQLLKEWRGKTTRMSVSVHWGIPDWANEMPTFQYSYLPPLRARSWKELGVEGITIETSAGGGAMGIGLYLAGQLFWSPEAGADKLLDEFYTLAFRAAAPPMRRLLHRWSTDFTATSLELGYSYRDLKEARERVAKDPVALARVRDYEIYLHYIRLWTEYQHAQRDTAMARAILTYLYRVHDSGMVHTSRMRDLIINRYSKNPQLSAEFNPSDASAAGWAAARQPLQDRELSRLMREGAAAFPPLAVERKQFSSRLVQPGQGLPAAPDDPTRLLLLVHPTDFEIEVPENRRLEMEITIKKHPFIPFEAVSVYDSGGKALYDERFPADGLSRRIDLAVPPGRYRVHVEDQKAMFTVRPARGLPTVMRTFFSMALSPRVYFWVPAGVRKVAMYVPSVIPVELFDGDGARVESPGTGILLVDVPPGQDGRAWSIRGYKSSETVRMINVPQVFALSPDSLLVPEGTTKAP